jgi:uncharacterized protein with FMN-binding domain
MLSHAKEHESLSGKLLLSTALVAVTLGYGWWQHNEMTTQQAAAMAAMQMQAAPAQPQAPAQTQAMTAAPQTAATPDAAQTETAPAPGGSAAAAPAAPSSQMAMAAPQTAAPQVAASAAPAPQSGTPGQTALLPADAPKTPPPMPLTGMDAIRAFLPTEGVSPPLPPVSGTPDANATPVLPAGGTHLEDGDYTSDRVQFEWGDLRARIVVTGGKITTVQIVSYPDHRSQSLYLIQLADPILTQEVIKTQQSKVNVVSSATNSSIAFQDAIAGAIVKATR